MPVPAFLSRLEDVEVHESGWFPISADVEVTKLPLVDRANDIFARLGAGLARKRLAELGARLPTVEEYDRIHALGFHIEPYALPTMDMVRAAGIDLHDAATQIRFRETHMMTLAWCKLHDAEVFRRLAGWDGSTPVDNAGKHWAEPSAAHPAKPGHALIYGWWTPRARAYGVHNDVMIQEPSDFHDDAYTDYATTIHGARLRSG